MEREDAATLAQLRSGKSKLMGELRTVQNNHDQKMDEITCESIKQ
jgi:hypothetical protein